MLLLAAALVLGSAAAASQQPAVTVELDQPLAFSIRYADGRVVRRTIGPTHSSWTPMFPRIEGWTGHVGALPVAAVRYRATRREAGLDVVVSVLRGQQHQDETEIARVTLSDSTPVSIAGLAAFGVRPIELWIEPGDRTRVYSPAVENRTAGLDVTSLEIEEGPPAMLVATVRNLSGKPVVTYNVEVLGSARRLLLAAWQALASGLPVIAPGGSHTFRMNVASVPQPELLVIAGVQWSDGTFEGDARAATAQWCRDAAGRAQIDRILVMLRAGAGTDLATALARLEGQADWLEIVALPAIVADATSRLPDPPPMASHELASTIAFQLQRLKKEFVAEVVAARPRAGNLAATREWFDAAIAAYQDRLTALSTR